MCLVYGELIVVFKGYKVSLPYETKHAEKYRHLNEAGRAHYQASRSPGSSYQAQLCDPSIHFLMRLSSRRSWVCWSPAVFGQ